MENLGKKYFIKRVPSDDEAAQPSYITNSLYLRTQSVLYASINTKTRKIKTGLEDYKEEDLNNFERELGLNKGELSTSAFWEEFAIKIPYRGRTLDTSIARDRLEYIVLCTLPNVAQGTSQVGKMKSMTTTQQIFVLTNSEIEAETKLSKFEVKMKANEKFSEMGHDDYFNLLIFTAKNPYNMSPKAIKAGAYEELELDAKRFLSIVDHPLFQDTVFIQKCIFYHILKQQGGAIYQGESILGTTIDNTIMFLNEPKNQVLKLAMMAELEEKENGGNKEPKKSAGRPKTNV